MAEYIEREAILKEIAEIGGHLYSDWETAGVIALVCRQPAADVAPVVHGRWEWDEDHHGYYCPHCPTIFWKSPDVPDAFKNCPSCGARMDGE